MITPIVPPEGSLDSRIAIIGEAPGAKEDRYRRPFIGPVGEKLMELLRMVGLDRKDVYLTNTIKQRPGQYDNDVSSWFTVNQQGKVWTSDAFNEYVKLLYDELRKTQANVFVPLGRVAMYALTGQVKIMKYRGSILQGLAWPGMKVIPTVHPGSIVTGGVYLNTHLIRMDLVRAKEESEYPDIRLPIRTIVTEPGFEQTKAYLLDILQNHDNTSFDIEVINEELGCLSFSKSPTDIICIPFVKYQENYFNPIQELELLRLIAQILENPAIEKRMQNGDFDTAFMHRKYGICTANVHDTMIAQGILYPDFPKGLDFQTAMYTKEPYYKDDGKKWFKLGGTVENFWLYNAKDSAVLDEINPIQRRLLKHQENEDTYEMHCRLIPILNFIQECGMRVDTEGMKKASDEAQTKMDGLEAQFKQICGYDINLNSPAQLCDYFYTRKGVKAYTKFNKQKRTSSPTVDVDACKRLARAGHKEAKILLDYRKWEKLKSTYFDMKLSPDGRIRSAMNPVGTRNGRLSSSEDIFGEGGNIQNLPDVMRKFILPDEGYMLYQVDLSQAENRIVAYIAPEHTMIDAFETKKDVHSLTGGLISGLDPAEVKRQDKEQVKCALGNGDQTWRYWGKKSNHGLNYDEGFRTFALKNEITEAEAKWMIERYHKMYPGIRQYHTWIRNELAANQRFLTNLFGRRQQFLDEWGPAMWRVAYNYIPSSTVADIIDRWGLIYLYYNQQLFRPVEILNQIHDAIVFQIPLIHSWRTHAEILLRLKHSLEQPLHFRGITFRIPADFTMGFSLSKKAMEEVKIDGDQSPARLAEELHGVYIKLRASSSISTVDWYFCDLSLSSEEVLPAMG